MSIRFDGVSFRYGENEDWVLREIALTIHPGERVAIVGSNGSGKSTLGMLLNGLLTPTEGDVYVFGGNTRCKSDLAFIRKNIGYIFQNPDQQIISNTVEDDVAFGLENLGISPADQERRIRNALHRLRLDALKQVDPHSLTPGQKQKLAVAGVIATEPEVIVIDEAMSMLSPRDAEALGQVWRDLHKQGTTIVQITHDMEELYECERAVVVKEGTIVADDSPRRIFASGGIWKEAGLLPPFAVRVREALTDHGISFGQDAYTEDDLVTQLCEYVSKT